jgi:thiamine biosynthesis lipoprotein
MTMAGMVEVTRSFTAMNTEVEAIICVPGSERNEGEKALAGVQGIFQEVETALSRFSPESELSRLNQAKGARFTASHLLFTVVSAAKEAACFTGGIYDPTILPYLLAAGYDRSFEKLSDDPDGSVYQLNRRFNWRDIILDADASTVTLPAGCGLDLGGIAKGWTVDRMSEGLKNTFGFAVNAGGDIFAGGKRADGSLWSVGVVDPLHPDLNLTILELTDRAVCTSSTARRNWRHNSIYGHHLIDPRNGKPSDSPVISATITAESAVTAEIIAKTALILGPVAGMEFIQNQSGIDGILVLNDGRLLRSSNSREVTNVN